MLQAIAVALALLVPIASSVGQHKSAHPQPISSMTPEELAWLDQHEPVRMVYDPDWAPFEWQSADGVHTGSGRGHGVFIMSPRADIASGKIWDLTNVTPYADDMRYDNLQLVDMDNDGDLDVLTSEEGEGFFTVGDGVLWFENPLK